MSLVLFTQDGGILVANGRRGYSSIRKQTSAGILADFDTFAEWVRAGNGRPDDDVSDEMRARVIEACRLGERLVRDEDECAEIRKRLAEERAARPLIEEAQPS